MTDIAQEDLSERRARDNARLKKVATKHGAALLTAFTLWGAADQWATSSGLLLAHIVALLNAIFAGTAIAYLCHEWGHFAGARISGAVSPVMKEPRSFFMFTFKDEMNTSGQFLSMSMGGPAANWLFAILMLLMLPLATASQALFFATAFAIAVSVSVFEFPVINRILYGENPKEVLQQRIDEAGSTPKMAGIAAGAVIFLLAW
jgi:hypothetical protein